jgi:hypothetical protein
MATLVINAWSVAFPDITNQIRVDISPQSSPLAIVASQTKDAPHPVRIWSFPGLVRTNYIFDMNEIDGSGNPIRNLAYFDIVPGNLQNVLVRGEEQIKVGSTPGLTAGTSTFTFDGREDPIGSGLFRPDWRGWEISPEEYSGVGTLIRGTDYAWDKVTGTWAFLIPGFLLQNGQWYTVEFEAQAGGAGGSVPTVIDFATRIITASETLSVNDFGTKIIVEPAGLYIELTLPPIATVVPGRALMVETQNIAAYKCVKFIMNGADHLAFLNNSLYMMMNESLHLYKLERGGGVYEWRVSNEVGHFKEVGNVVGNEKSQVFNRVALSGGYGDKFVHARIYNEFILRLPVGQVVNFDDWTSGDNNKRYSLANSANPANANHFMFPDRRGLVEKGDPGTGRIVGSFENQAVGPHRHNIQGIAGGDNNDNNNTVEFAGGDKNPDETFFIFTNTQACLGEGDGMGLETNVRNYSTIKYVLV